MAPQLARYEGTKTIRYVLGTSNMYIYIHTEYVHVQTPHHINDSPLHLFWGDLCNYEKKTVIRPWPYL